MYERTLTPDKWMDILTQKQLDLITEGEFCDVLGIFIFLSLEKNEEKEVWVGGYGPSIDKWNKNFIEGSFDAYISTGGGGAQSSIKFHYDKSDFNLIRIMLNA